jgi:hypothetical protein
MRMIWVIGADEADDKLLIGDVKDTYVFDL